MEDIFPILTSSPLFAGIGAKDFESMLVCLSASRKTYGKEEVVLMEGDTVTEIGLLLTGRLHLFKSDVWGNNSIITEITPPGMFAEAVVCGGIGRAPVGIVAKDPSAILFMDYRKIVTTCSSACVFHAKLIRNMIGVLARKNIQMADKMEHMSRRTTKEKLLSYLNAEARQKNSKVFDIPYNRQELADFLSVERSAMSAEMGKLKKSGILACNKNHFELLRETPL